VVTPRTWAYVGMETPGVGVTMSDWREDSKMAVALKVRISMVCGDAPQR
jgi:hypothetical protein